MRIDCNGTRQPTIGLIRAKPTDGQWAKRYGRGRCQVCAKIVTRHKDGSAVPHVDTRQPA